MNNRNIILVVLLTLILSFNLQAKNQLRVVGSSTIFPFSSLVAEELGATTTFPTPIIESTGSGGGIKLFCKSNNINTPSIVNVSRHMLIKEFKQCQSNGVTDITEVMIGFDGIAFAQSKENKVFDLTKKQLLFAVAAEVPSSDGKSLIKNPYKFWNEIDSSLPKREIIIYGPPTSSGTRDAFEDMVMLSLTDKLDVYKSSGYKKYNRVRQDGIYIPSGENDNLIVQKLTKNRKAFGIFGYSFLVENEDRIIAAKIDGIDPTIETISDREYPISRSLFFYIKNSHSKLIPSMDKYISLFLSEDIMGEDSVLTDIGLIHLPDELRNMVQNCVIERVKLTLKDIVREK